MVQQSNGSVIRWFSSAVPGESKKYTCLTRHNTALIALILKIRLGLDRYGLKLKHDTIKVIFTSLLIELLKHKPAASF